MMNFTKPVGATADLRELEYIAALHQTGKTLRKDGTIQSDDISKFLMSRYGIKVTEDEVTNTIAKGFGGGGISEEDGDTVDLTEIVALLFVPTLLKAEISLHRERLEKETIKAGHRGTDIVGENSGNEMDEMSTAHADYGGVAVDLALHKHKAGRADVWGSGMHGRTRALRGEDRWPDSDIIGFVLGMILADVTGDNEPKPMTKDLLRKIFLFYGEHDVAEDEALLEEMIAVASSTRNPDEENVDPIFDQFTFAHCLTDDVRRYDIKSEDRLSTNFFDVFETEEEDGQAPMAAESVRKVNTVWTAPAIDYAVDTFRSKPYVILLWVNWALFFYVFMWDSSSHGQLSCSHDASTASGFGCAIAQGIISWLIIMAKLVILGSGSVLICSMGQDINPTTPFTMVLSILSMVSICMVTFIPAFVSGQVLADAEGNAMVNTLKEDRERDEQFLVYVMVAFGIILILLAIQNVLARAIPARYLDNMIFLKRILSSGTISMEQNMKMAASFKVNQIIRNARTIHAAAEFEHGAGSSSRKESSYGRALLSFTKTSDHWEEMGGFFWTWRRLLNGKLYQEDGIWLNNRMLQGNVGQLVLCLWLIPNMQGVSNILNIFYESVLVMVAPAQWRILVPLAAAFGFAEFNALKLATSYIPSSVRTTLRYRYGVIGSLHHVDFQQVRTAVDDASFIFGAMFWGCLFSSLLVLLVSLLIFGLLCFEPFLPFLLQFVATVIGICITIGLKKLFLMFSRRKFHQRAFYRSNPAAANIVGVILEAWSLGISTLYVLKRMVFLLFASFVFVGRIDIPFLSEDADQIGPMTLDRFPIVFRKDLLMHEAHRHPYLERIGALYMLKLKYGDDFGRAAGSSWRLLFVFALLPWFRKYRIRSDEIDVDKFNFSQESTIFRKFVSAKADGLHGQNAIASTTEESASDDNAHATIASLKKEINDLREENERLKIRRGRAESKMDSSAAPWNNSTNASSANAAGDENRVAAVGLEERNDQFDLMEIVDEDQADEDSELLNVDLDRIDRGMEDAHEQLKNDMAGGDTGTNVEAEVNSLNEAEGDDFALDINVPVDN